MVVVVVVCWKFVENLGGGFGLCGGMVGFGFDCVELCFQCVVFVVCGSCYCFDCFEFFVVDKIQFVKLFVGVFVGI